MPLDARLRRDFEHCAMRQKHMRNNSIYDPLTAFLSAQIEPEP
jgi:hypothetical protein